MGSGPESSALFCKSSSVSDMEAARGMVPLRLLNATENNDMFGNVSNSSGSCPLKLLSERTSSRSAFIPAPHDGGMTPCRTLEDTDSSEHMDMFIQDGGSVPLRLL